MKFKITVLQPKEIVVNIPKGERIEKYINENLKSKGLEIKNFEYIEELNLPNREWYCIWLNELEYRKDAVFSAPSREYVEYNIRPTLGITYDFYCVLNEPARIEALYRSIWD